MAFNLSKQDLATIISLAEYRVMTIRQLEVLYPGNKRVLRRKLKKFADQGLIRIGSGVFIKKRGRPQDVFSLGEEGFEFLKAKEILNKDISYERVKAITAHSLSHMLLINYFRIQLIQAEKIVPNLRTIFLSPNSPFIPRFDDDRPMVYERFALDKEGTRWVNYTPDGVFVLQCTQSKKTLLFFLEVDMATESLASGKGYKGNIEEKIINYQLSYKLVRYKRYESFFKCRLRGFRLLFLTNDFTRLGKLSKLIVQMPPSDFINITDQGSLSAKGLWAPIWYRGGRVDQQPVSILGSKTPENSPCPDELL